MIHFVKRSLFSSSLALLFLVGCSNSFSYASGAQSQTAVSVTGASQVTAGVPAAYTATIAGATSAAVTWSIQGYAGENDGTISATGVYTPPAVVPAHNIVYIIATSQAATSSHTSTQVTIMNPVPVIASATATPAYHSTLVLDVKGTGFNQASVLQIGGYTVPSTLVNSSEISYTYPAPAAGSTISLSVLNNGAGKTQSTVYALTAPAPIAVSVTGPGQSTISSPTQFSATVTGSSNAAVTWAVQGMAGESFGSISSTGLYTPPASVPTHALISVTATSQADSTKSSTMITAVVNPTPVINNVSTSWGSNGSFILDVTGSGFIPSSVLAIGGYGMPSMLVSSGEIKYTISSSVPKPGAQLALSVITPAPGKVVSAVYSLTVPSSISITATGPGQSTISTPAQFTAAVTGSSNTAVTWTAQGMAGESFGSISSTGLYTPPASVPVHALISITATSKADTTKSSTIITTLNNPTPVIVSATPSRGTNGSLILDVKGSGFVPSSQLGISGFGVSSTLVSSSEITYTISSSLPAPGSQLALSVITPAPGKVVSSTVNVTVPGAIAISIAGPGQSIISTPAQFTASVSGNQNTAVTWTAQGMAGESFGSISSTGLYTPPSSVPVHALISITATSKADPTKSSTMITTVVNPTPVINAVATSRGSNSSLTLDVTGSGFTSSSVLAIGGYGVASTLVSSTEIKYFISSSLPAPGSQLALSVITPAPGKVISSTYSLLVPALVAVSVTGPTQTTVNAPVQFAAAVTGTSNTGVTWKVQGSSGQNFGTISATGLYTPPATVPPNNIVIVTATSALDPTKYSTTQIAVMNLTPTITSATATKSGNNYQLSITGSNFLQYSSVQFQGTGIYTTYSSANSLTALIQTPQTAGAQISISVVNPNPGKTQSGSFNLIIPGAVGVTVVGQPQVSAGSTAQFFATVTGTTNTAVTWSLSPATANGVSTGTISQTGLYTPPATVSANTNVTIIATSQVQTTQSGSATVTVVGTTTAAATRLLEQATFGPTDSEIAKVQSIGLSAYIDQQMATPPTYMQVLGNPLPTLCTGNAHVCNDMNFWSNAVTAPDQLRQRVAFALGEIFVVSNRETNDRTIAPYVNNMLNDAFGNWYSIMKDVTLSAAMGNYLNMTNSAKAPAGQIANENFARENMQLFNIGLNLLNQDGTLQTDGSGNPIPSYSEEQVEAFAKAFTGWTWATPDGSVPAFPNWTNADLTKPLVANESYHDTTAKALLNTTLPAGQTAEKDVADALTDVFNHPNVGPFVCKQLIRHLVKSNPSPAYVGRIAAVFANDGNGVRGNMAAVVKALLLDEEARAGDTTPATNDGHLREPILWTANVLRALGAVPKAGVTDNSAYTAIPSFSGGLGEYDFESPTVFNFFPADWQMGNGMIAPEFALENSATILAKLSLANNIVLNQNGKLTIDLTATSALGKLAAVSNDALLDELNKLLLHGQMSSQMRATISNTLSGITDPAQRVRMAVYLVITSTQYKIIH